jgi:starch synthase
MKILQVAAEHFGLAKTGGLADMVSSLCTTLAKQGNDVRACIPAYPGTLDELSNSIRHGTVTVYGQRFNVVEGRLPTFGHSVILLDCPTLFNRQGDPYRDENGTEFDDNGWRFGCFNAAVVELIESGVGGWRPDIVHLHDWHTGLVPALLAHKNIDVRTVFTIHNFSFHGVFGRGLFDALNLPQQWWHHESLEFYGNFSFMKSALKYANIITAVSPRYAEEIQTPEYGSGLEGVVQNNADRLCGIVNGIDMDEWNPSKDSYIASPYNGRSVKSGKRLNKSALQKRLGLPMSNVPLVAFIGRLADQKGPDLIVAARDKFSQLPVQVVILGSGDKSLENACRQWANDRPDQVAARIEVNEELAHLVTAAADLQLMPSRFEPCGLSQMYAQRYGTLPVARSTGGLTDTITDATAETVAAGNATGFLFQDADVESLMTAVDRALGVLADSAATKKMRQTAMKRDFSWSASANAYLALYRDLVPQSCHSKASA